MFLEGILGNVSLELGSKHLVLVHLIGGLAAYFIFP